MSPRKTYRSAAVLALSALTVACSLDWQYPTSTAGGTAVGGTGGVETGPGGQGGQTADGGDAGRGGNVTDVQVTILSPQATDNLTHPEMVLLEAQVVGIDVVGDQLTLAWETGLDGGTSLGTGNGFTTFLNPGLQVIYVRLVDNADTVLATDSVEVTVTD